MWHIGMSGNVLINQKAYRVNSYNVWGYTQGSNSYYRSMLVDLTQPHNQVCYLSSFCYWIWLFKSVLHINHCSKFVLKKRTLKQAYRGAVFWSFSFYLLLLLKFRLRCCSCRLKAFKLATNRNCHETQLTQVFALLEHTGKSTWLTKLKIYISAFTFATSCLAREI